MEISKQPIKAQYIRAQLWDRVKRQYTYEVFKSKPIRKSEEDKIYKCKTETTITFTPEEYTKILEENSLLYKSRIYEDDIIHILKKQNAIPTSKFIRPSYKEDWGDKLVDNKNPSITVLLEEDIEIIETLSSREKQRLAKEEEKRLSCKLFDTFFLPNVKVILNKYGLRIGNNKARSVCFKDYTALKTFIQKAIKETIIKELEELGIEVPLYNKWMRFDVYSTLFDLDKVIVKVEKEEEVLKK